VREQMNSVRRGVDVEAVQNRRRFGWEMPFHGLCREYKFKTENRRFDMNVIIRKNLNLNRN